MGGWVGAGAGLDAMENRKVFRPCQVSNPLSPSSAHNLATMSPEKCNVALINEESEREIHVIGIDKIATSKMVIWMAKAGREGTI
jgi:hypothetical protein